KTGQVDIAYLFGGPIAEELKRTPGLRVVAPLLYGIYWLDFLDQWDPKSPWHDRRVRLAASLAIDRKANNQAEMLGLGQGARDVPERVAREEASRSAHRRDGRGGQRRRAAGAVRDEERDLRVRLGSGAGRHVPGAGEGARPQEARDAPASAPEGGARSRAG